LGVGARPPPPNPKPPIPNPQSPIRKIISIYKSFLQFFIK